jgi:predicted Rossmann fold flavoprotein
MRVQRFMNYDVVIIGAGGAGMMTAIHAARRGRRVVLLDHSEKIGRKILISGGGRCNFTNIHSSPENFVSKNPHFCKSALSRYTPKDFITLVKSHRIPFHEKKLGQLFCDDSAKNIVEMLVHECLAAGAEFKLTCRIDSVSCHGHFKIKTNLGTINSESLVIASGGLSIPQIGATGFGYELAKQFGMKIIEPEPALDGFVFNRTDHKHYEELSGISVDSLVTCSGTSFRENILFTHTGLSGPACLQASLYWQRNLPVEINLAPNENSLSWLTQHRKQFGKSETKNVLSDLIPKRLAEKLCALNAIKGPMAEVSDKLLKELASQIESWQFRPGGTVGFRKAEVTRGGVDTNELSSQTMESKKIPGLFFVGEVVDVTGQLGGHNFQWAWASGFAAGENV